MSDNPHPDPGGRGGVGHDVSASRLERDPEKIVIVPNASFESSKLMLEPMSSTNVREVYAEIKHSDWLNGVM